MSLKEFGGVFSRHFVVGYFAPAFFGLIAYVVLLSERFTPERWEDAEGANQVLLIGGAALLVALLLNGFNARLTSVYSGHSAMNVLPFSGASIEFGRDTPGAAPSRRDEGPIRRWLRGRQVEHWNRLQAVIDDPQASEGDKTLARQIRASRLGYAIGDVQPTRLGSARTAAAGYARDRWGFDSWAGWSRLEPLVGDAEREARQSAEADMAFYLNSSLLTFTIAVLTLVDRSIDVDGLRDLDTLYAALAVAVGPALCWLLYRLALPAAETLSALANATVDLHYPELLAKLGATDQSIAQLSADLTKFWLEGERPEWMERVRQDPATAEESGWRGSNPHN